MLRRLIVLTAVVALLVPATALANPNQQAAGDYVIVTLKDKPLASYSGEKRGFAATKPARGKLDRSSPAYRAYERFLANEHANYRAFLARNAPSAQVVAEYTTVLNGFAIKLNGTSPDALLRHPSAAAVGNSWLYQPTMNVSVDIINAAAAWSEAGGREDAGSGIKIGIVDTGIDTSHDFFECKDEIPAKVYASGVAGLGIDIVFDHGTHVAGTAAGCVIQLTDGPITGTISGVAPGAELWDYNVFPGYGGGFVAFGGSAFSHDIARALEDAVRDGIDVINMSLGGAIQGPRDFLAEATNATVDAGVVVVASAGNEGPGSGTIGSPGNAARAIGVGATTNSHYVGVPVETPFGIFGAAVGDFDPFAEAPVTDAPFVAWGGDELACGGSPATAVTGAVTLIKRGTCTFATKVATAAAAGAIGVVVYNNVGGDPTAMGGTGALPAVMVSLEDGETIRGNLPSTVSIDGTEQAEIHTDNADIMAGFSSRGPGQFLDNIKPDVVAPGVNIYSSVFDNEFAMFQGTSMASPHVAGAAALLLDAWGGSGSLTPSDVKSLLGNTAERTVWASTVDGDLAGVMDRGGGRIDLETATAADTSFDPMSLSFGRHRGNRQVNQSVAVTVTNLSGAPQTYTVSEADPRLSVSPTNLAVPAGGSATFTVTLSARGFALSEGDITVSDGTTSYLLPFWYSTGSTGP